MERQKESEDSISECEKTFFSYALFGGARPPNGHLLVFLLEVPVFQIFQIIAVGGIFRAGVLSNSH